jgi:Domain of unknown function (DUF4157)
MTRQNAIQTQQQAASASPLSRGGILQRQCESCGQHTIAGAECGDCGKKKIGLQRKLTIGASNDPLELEADRVMAASPNSVVSSTPPSIQRFTGQVSEGNNFTSIPTSIESVLNDFGEPRDLHDFSRVRIHGDDRAAQSAEAVDALAYTVGQHVVMGGNQYKEGQHLLAHELTHVVQQEGHASRQDSISVMPKREEGLSENQPVLIPRMVYDAVNSSGKQMDDQSLNWANHYFRHDMSHVRIHDDDRAAFSAHTIQAKAYTVGSDIVFSKGQYAPNTDQGRHLLAHELTHVIQQEGNSTASLVMGTQHNVFEAQADRVAAAVSDNFAASSAIQDVSRGSVTSSIQRNPDDAPKTVDAAMCEANANPHPSVLGTCSYKEPQNCPTYEGWIDTFMLLKASDETSDTPGTNKSNINVLGSGAASKDFRKVKPEPGSPPPPHSFAPLKPGERFIDHPTDEWVKTCLPANLRDTAYRLPADCADIAMILRHVWLAAHHRTQKFDKWILGDLAGKASEKRIKDVISSAGTWEVENLVAPYSDAKGNPLRSIKQLSPLLHPGDILVWWHYDNGFDKKRTGGHTHTISSVERDNTGTLTNLTLLQGNEPLFEGQKKDIQEFLTKENPRQKPPDKKTLGSAPGRRIEKAEANTSDLKFEDSDPTSDKSPAPIWKWRDNTLLIVAGPPKSAPRPAATPQKGQKGKAVRRLTDWIPPLSRSVAEPDLVANFESMLFEARATVESNVSLIEAEARSVGSAAGVRIWELGKKAKDLANASHFKPMQDILDILWAFQNSRNIVSRNADTQYEEISSRLSIQLGWIKEAFELSARGISDISFGESTGTKNDKVNVLITGFDPFEPSGSLQRPSIGEWNPSGAAALSLDGQKIPVSSTNGAKGIAKVESIVLPVTYEAFKDDIVEKAISSHAKEVDAVLTVSEDPGLDPSQPVRLERYVVGVHSINNKIEGVPAASAGSAGPAIIESSASLNEIASATETPAKKGIEGIKKPTIGEGIMFQFRSIADADAALVALGLPAGGSMETEIADEKALHQIISSMKRIDISPEITFQAGGKSFIAMVVKGPGGNFLSNEVSFRSLRLLASSSTKEPISFHTHTQRSDAIPDDTGSAESKKNRKNAIGNAMGLRNKIVVTLKRIIGAVGGSILNKRSSSKH